MCVISGAERAEHTAKVAKLERELATSQILITELRQQLQAQMQLQEATNQSCSRDGREGDGGRGSQAVPRGHELRQDFYDGISPDEVKNLSLILLYELVA